MMCDARLYGPQIAALSGKTTLHLPPISEFSTVENLAESVLANAPPRFSLAGLSMGGIVAMEIVRLAPSRVERLALLDTNPRAELDTVKRGREPQIERVRSGGLMAVMRDELKPNYLADGPKRNEVLDMCMKMALSLGPDVFERQSRALQNRYDQQETLSMVQVPTLILMGREDRLCPFDRHQLMHDLIGNSVLQIVDGAGHLPTLEQPEAVTRAMEEWLTR